MLEDLLEALARLGYRPDPTPEPSTMPGADGPPASAERQQLHAVKLLLRCGTAMLHRARAGGASPVGAAALLAWGRACCLLRWDPAGRALDSDLRPSLAEALAGLQGLPAATAGVSNATGVVESLGSALLSASPSPAATLDLLVLLAGCPGGQAPAGALGDGLLRTLVPAGLVASDAAAAGPRPCLEPANVVLQQPWCARVLGGGGCEGEAWEGGPGPGSDGGWPGSGTVHAADPGAGDRAASSPVPGNPETPQRCNEGNYTPPTRPPPARISQPQRLVQAASAAAQSLQVAGPAADPTPVLPGGMAALELVLAACDALLWHPALHGALPPGELAAWLGFLAQLQLGIKALRPEDQAVKMQAAQLELEYRTVVRRGPTHLGD